MVFTNFSFRRSMLYPFLVFGQDPRSGFSSGGGGGGGGLLRTRKSEQTRGGPRACSTGKISYLSLLKWL